MKKTKEYDDITGEELKYKNYFNFQDFEKLNFDDKHQFLIEEKIIIKEKKIKYNYHCAINSSSIGFKYEDEFDFDTSYMYNCYWYVVKQKIIDEYYNYLFVRIETEGMYGHMFADINKIENKIKFLNNNKKKKEILNDCYNEYALEFGSYGLELDYLNEPGQQHNSWKELITYLFDKELYAYLSGFSLTPDEDSVINYWIKVREITTMMHFCMNKLDEIKNSTSTENQQKRNKLENNKTSRKSPFDNNKISNYPLIFVNKGKELFFDHFLKSFKIIDENEIVDKNLIQTHSDAFYRAAKELEDDTLSYCPQILQSGRIKTKFHQMIIKKYNLNTTGLSKGNKHTNKVIDFIKNSFKNEKE
jgi:hypothetical protein